MEYPKTTKNVGQPCVICGQPANAQAQVEALQKKYDGLLGKYRQLMDFYDKHNGTPCEQIRHQQQVEALQRVRDEFERERDQLHAALMEAVLLRDHNLRRCDVLDSKYKKGLAAVKVLQSQLSQLQAQLADRDAMILQMGEQAAVLAKENMAVKAQLRQVEGDRQTLRQLVEVHTKQLTELTIIPIGCSREQELRWTQSIKDLRAALADVDAALQPERGRND